MSSKNSGHRIAFVRYHVETIECVCGISVSAEPDAAKHDRHGPLGEAWAEHKRASGVVPRQGGRDYKRVTA